MAVAATGMAALLLTLVPGLPKAGRWVATGVAALALALVTARYRRTKADGPDQGFLDQHIRDLFEHSPSGFHSVDADGVVIHMNQTELGWLGYGAEEVIGRRRFFDLLTPEARKVSEQVFEILKNGQAVHDLELELVRRDGSILPVIVNAMPVLDENGQFIYSRSMALDMTGLRHITQELRETAAQLEQRVAERTAELALSESRFRALAETIPQLIWRCLPDGSCDYLNRRWVEYTGLPESAQWGSGWWDQVHPEDRAAARAAWRETVEQDAPFDLELRLRRFDGAYRWFATRAVAWRDEQGQVVRWFGTNTDIDALRRAEEATRLWRLTFEQAEIPISLTEPTLGRVGLANAAYARMLGYEPWQLSGLTVEQRYTPDELPHIVEVLSEADARGHLVFESTMLRKDGTTFPVRVDLTSVRNEHGEMISRVAFLKDLTESRQTALRLKAQTERWALVQEATHVGVFEWNLANGEVIWSESQEQLYGVKAGTFPGHYSDWLQLLLPEERALVQDRQKRTASGTFWNEFQIRRPDTGEVRWIEARGKICLDEQGQPTRAIGVNVDITERKTVEQEVRRLNAQLEERVRARTRQLEEVNHELEAFAYSVSHDLRAPLRGIDGWSTALEEDFGKTSEERARGYIARVRAEAQRMNQLIDDLLALSQLGRATLAHGAVELSALARVVAERLREAEPRRQLEFVITPGVMAVGDERLLEVVLTNLLGNAVKFTGTRQAARIEFGVEERDGEQVYYVRDNGVGFDASRARKLFGAFQRLHRASDFPGTGIGLATVRRIVQRHGGRIWADAEVERGATFYFTLPAGEFHAQETERIAG
jgi:PAS domain S-box-containing protein